MDKEKMVNNIRYTLTSFIDEIFDINMAMLIKDLNKDTYTFLLSSNGFNILTPFEATKLAAKFFYERLDSEDFSGISRINIVHTCDPSIRCIYQAMNIKGGIVHMQNCQIFNVLIEDAILLESHID